MEWNCLDPSYPLLVRFYHVMTASSGTMPTLRNFPGRKFLGQLFNNQILVVELLWNAFAANMQKN